MHILAQTLSGDNWMLFQHVPVSAFPVGVGTGADGGLHSGVPLWVSLALLAAAAQRLRLLQVSRTGVFFVFACFIIWIVISFEIDVLSEYICIDLQQAAYCKWCIVHEIYSDV